MRDYVTIWLVNVLLGSCDLLTIMVGRRYTNCLTLPLDDITCAPHSSVIRSGGDVNKHGLPIFFGPVERRILMFVLSPFDV